MQWLIGRVLDKRPRGLTGITALWSLSKTPYPSLVLVQPRKTRPCLTERLLMGLKVPKSPMLAYRVKSDKFGLSDKFGQRSCLFHILIIGIKNKLTKQTVKIQMRLLIKSCLIWISSFCKCMSEFTVCPKLPDFTQ